MNGINDEYINEAQIVTLTDDEGNDVDFDHVMTFVYDNEKYVALIPLDEVKGVGEDEVLILKIDSSSGKDVYVSVDNEVLLDELFEEFLRLLDEMIDEEEGEE